MKLSEEINDLSVKCLGLSTKSEISEELQRLKMVAINFEMGIQKLKEENRELAKVVFDRLTDDDSQVFIDYIIEKSSS